MGEWRTDQQLKVVSKVIFIHHIIRDDLCHNDDDDDYKLYAQANTVACKFHMWTDDIKESGVLIAQ